MAEYAYGFRLYVRRWQLHRQAAVTAICGILWLSIPLGLYDVPARDGVQAALWPLVPALSAALLPAVLATGAEVLERMVPHPARLRALTACLVAILAVGLACCGMAVDMGVALRNTILLTGLAFFGSWLLPPGAAWSLPALTPMVMWLVGTKLQGEAEPWAVLLLPDSVGYTWGVAISAFIVGAIGYLRYGPRG